MASQALATGMEPISANVETLSLAGVLDLPSAAGPIP